MDEAFSDDLFGVFEGSGDAAAAPSTPSSGTAASTESATPNSVGKGKGKKTLAERLAGNKRTSLPEKEGKEEAKKKKKTGEDEGGTGKSTNEVIEESSGERASKRKEEVDEVSLAEVLPRITIHTVETLEACTHEGTLIIVTRLY